MIPNRKIGDIIVCPICKNKFNLTENHKFVREGDFTCSWCCFLGTPKKTAESANLCVSECENESVSLKEDRRKEYRRNYYLKRKREREQLKSENKEVQ